jgi:hypothetical protein
MAAYFTRTGGSPFFPPSSIKQVSSNYSIQPTDFYIGVNGTGVTVTLPDGSTINTGQSYVIKDESGLINTNSAYRITINTPDSKTIDGSVSLTVVNSWTSVTLLWTGLTWSII